MFIKQIISSNLNLKQIPKFISCEWLIPNFLFELLSNQCSLKCLK
jgi:hypothetical protein